MKFFHLVLIIPFLFFLFSCERQNEKRKGNLEYYFDFEKEISRLESENPMVSKTVIRQGKKQTVIDTIQWNNELDFFVKADINKPRFTDSYDLILEENNSVKTAVYKAKTDLPVRIVKLTYREDAIEEIYIRKEAENLITSSRYELSYFPNRKYFIKANQKVPFLYDEDLFIEGNFSKWRGVLQIENDSVSEEIPFLFYLFKQEGKDIVEIENAEERILCDEVSRTGDSLVIKLPVYQSEIKAAFFGDTLLKGAWFNYSKGDYSIPFKAEFGKTDRFQFTDEPDSIMDISGKWETVFSPGTMDSFPAVGIFEQEGATVTGTFLTETGDYRFLEGAVADNKLFLSGFNGAQAFLFKAVLKDSILNGKFFSGKHWSTEFSAKRNPDAKLTHPDSLTFLKEGFEKLSFSFPDTDSNMVSLSDEKFRGKVVIVQIMGSWCPNCLDETVYLSGLYRKMNAKGLEIIGLSFERNAAFGKAKEAVSRFKEKLQPPYTILIAGTASVAKANEALPMLKKVMSFPTTIFIDKKGKVRKIHTGFYGPGTGDYFDNYKMETEEFAEKLLKE